MFQIRWLGIESLVTIFTPTPVLSCMKGQVILVSLFTCKCFTAIVATILQAFMSPDMFIEMRFVRESFLTLVAVELELSCVKPHVSG